MKKFPNKQEVLFRMRYANHLCVLFLENSPREVMIISPTKEKIKYIDEFYAEDMSHKRNPSIKIVGVCAYDESSKIKIENWIEKGEL